jgi:protein-L-isoaspartate(D-aspartate) O-methyltransferase
MEKNLLIDYWKKTKLIKNQRILNAFKEIPREKFILEEYKAKAYYDIPLPIFEEQTISQPTTVVMMLDFLDVKEDSKILEIGAGSGYNAALLSKLTKNKIITIERIKGLADFAKNNLKKTKIINVKVIHGDGTEGYKKEAPYDRIIATCSSPYIPEAWKEQLKEEGILVAPIGYLEHEMIVAKKIKGGLKIENKGAFRFVPLVSGKQ